MKILEQWAAALEASSGVPAKVVAALAVVALGLLTALLVRIVVARFVRRLARIVPDGGKDNLSRAVTEHRTDRLVGRAVFWIILLVAVMTATEILGLPVLTAWLGAVAAYLPKLFAAFLIGVVGVIAGALARHTLSDAPALDLIGGARTARFVQIAIVSLSLLVAAQQLGLELGFLTTIVSIVLSVLLAAAGLAFGLGSRATVANILAMHYVHELYEVGQTVRAGDVEGSIVRFTRTAVVVQTEEGEAAVPGDAFASSTTVRVHRVD